MGDGMKNNDDFEFDFEFDFEEIVEEPFEESFGEPFGDHISLKDYLNNLAGRMFESLTVKPKKKQQKQQKGMPYSLFNKMRQQRNTYSSYNYYSPYYHQDPGQFYVQGKFMETFEDDFESIVNFEDYHPTYSLMEDDQLRTYFTWRTKVRKGSIEETCFSYVILYIYELINQIGIKSPMEGYEKLLYLWLEYREISQQIDEILKKLMKDYIIYYGIGMDKLQEAPVDVTEESQRLSRLIHALTIEDYSYFTEKLNDFIQYNIIKSPFYRDFNEDFDLCLGAVYQALKVYFSKLRKKALFQTLFGERRTYRWTCFEEIPFQKLGKSKDATHVLSDYEMYTCVNGEWKISHYSIFDINKQLLGEIVRGTEHFMREYYNYRRKIIFKPSSARLSSIIEKTVKQYCLDYCKMDCYSEFKNMQKLLKRQQKEMEAMSNYTKASEQGVDPIHIEIDVNKLDKIREDAQIIQEKLVINPDETVEEGNLNKIDTANMIEMKLSVTTDSAADESIVFRDLHLDLLKILLRKDCQEDLKNFLQQNGILLEVILEEMNEIGYEIFHDVITYMVDGQPCIYEYYIDDIKKLILKES